MHVLSIVNQKGGVAKTTSTINIGAALAARGLQTLLIDLDPQANLTLGLGQKQSSGTSGLDKVLLDWDNAELKDTLLQPYDLPLWLVPGSIEMARCEQILTPMVGSAYRLRRALETLIQTQQFDWVLIDCPPSLGRLTEIALMASTDLVIPTEAKYYSFAGIDILNSMLVRLMQDMMFDIRLLGVVITMFEQATRLQRSVAEEIRSRFGDKVFDTVIRRNTRVSESELSNLPVVVRDPQAAAARDYDALTTELLHRVTHLENTVPAYYAPQPVNERSTWIAASA
jgi:chromosome partitioning protein